MVRGGESIGMENDHVYIAIDLKSYYASCECADRKFDPLTTNLVVADMSRTEKTISSFSKEIYSLRISAPSDGIFRFVKVFYQENGAVDGIKYRFGDRYLFIFASEYNLIVTKSIMDLTEEDDTPVPIYDPSILFDNGR